MVEDQIEVRRLACAALRRTGYTVLEAANGNEALACADGFADRIHLLVADVIMPGMTGCEVAEKLLARRPDMRVLFMSGYADNAMIQKAAQAKDAGFLQKPFAPAALVAKVREILDA